MAATLDQGDSTFYWRVTGIVGLIVIAGMALARVLAWYVFRFGRRQLDDRLADMRVSPRRLGWEIAWKPVLMLVVMMYAIVCIPLGWMWLDETHDRESARGRRRRQSDSCRGIPAGGRPSGGLPAYWAPRGPVGVETTMPAPVFWWISPTAVRCCSWRSRCLSRTSAAS